MKQPRPHWSGVCHHSFRTLALVLLLQAAASQAAEPAALPTPRSETAPAAQTVDLAQCLHIAQQNPRLVAARASLASAEAQLHALENLHAVPFLPGGRELPIRRKQSALGVEIARADLARSELDVAYYVTRSYYTVVYAKAQKQVTGKLVGNLGTTHDALRSAVEGKGKDINWTTNDVRLAASYLGLAQERDIEATVGIQRALAALYEAMASDPHICFDVADERLPYRALEIDCKEIVALAVTRRGEVAQTDFLAQVTALEVDAQCKICGPQAKTFAAGADLHARLIPPDLVDGEYRPGGLAPEMPVFLVGKKCDRQQRAGTLADRAGAVAERTRNLIALEAKETYFRWLDASQRVPVTTTAAKEADALANANLEELSSGRAKAPAELVRNEVLGAQVESQRNEALFRYVIGLAALERVTGGGFCAGLAPTAPPAK